MDTFWLIRSRWDYLAFSALFVWAFVGLGVVAYGLSHVYTLLGFDALATIALLVFVQAIGVVILASGMSVLVPLATIYGSRHHDHLDPGPRYHLAALVFGPIVGLHYLYRTADHVQFQKRTDLTIEIDGSATKPE